MNPNSREASPRTTAEPVAIVGMGCLFPKANSLEAYWANIKAGVDAITDIPPSHWRPDDYFDEDPSRPDMTYAQRGGFLEEIDFDPLRYGINPNNIEATDTTQLLGMVAADHALRDAGYQPTPEDEGRVLDRARTSVILGVTGALELVIPLGARLGHPIWRKALADAGVEPGKAEEIIQQIADGYVPWQENSFPGLLGNVAAGRIANRFDLRGTNCVVDAACASSLSAIHLAAMELQTSRADTVVAGGLDTFNSIFMYMCFSKTPALSPTGNSRPFSADCDGTILGEGLGVVVLKRLADAERDGDRIYAVLKGMGTSSDGRGNAVYAPSAEGQAIALRAAYEQAGVSPASIELVEAHGTGTRVGDATEIKALTNVYREAADAGTWCAIGSVKSMIGHTKAAAGVAGLIKAALALHHKVLPPTIKVNAPLDALAPNTAPVYLNTQTRPWLPNEDHPRRAAISAFGFGGSNFHCVLEESGSSKPAIEWDARVFLYPLSAQSPEELSRLVENINLDQPWTELQKAAGLRRREFDTTAACRLVLVALRDETDLAKLVAGAKQMLASQGENAAWSTPEGAYFGRGEAPGKLAVLFPGQGAQRPEMFGDFACAFPAMLGTFATADRAFGGASEHPRLSDLIFPIPVFDDSAREAQVEALRDTRVAQPAIGAASSGMWQVLQELGLKVDAAAGHSFGELVALFAAGVIDQQTLLDLAVARGELMGAGTGDRGSMLAVAAEREEIEAYLADSKLPLVIANHNMPKQVVLSGATQAIEAAELELTAREIGCRRLLVSGAFHSTLVADAEAALAQRLEDVAWHQGQFPVYANTTGEAYPSDSQSARRLLAGQLARPVEFVKQIEQMYTDGVRTFVEVGPGKILTGLIRSILQDRPHHSIAVDHSRGRRPGQFDLANAVGQLAALGHGVELNRWSPGEAGSAQNNTKKKPAITIALTGANYIKPRPEPPRRATPEAPVAKENKVTEPMSTPPSPTPGQPSNSAAPHHNAAVPQAPQAASPSPAPAPPAMASNAVTNALQVTQQSIVALENMQQRNAELQRQFLEGQQTTQLTIARLIEQHQQMLSASLGMAPAPSIAPAALPPVATQPTMAQLAPLMPAAVQQPVYQQPAQPQPAPAAPAPASNAAPSTPSPQPTDPPASVEATPPVPSSDGIGEVLLEVVAEKTGYPQEMLDLQMSLDADLGIDSIKRVEILSALQERLPEVPPVESDELGNFETLGHVLARLQKSAPGSSGAVTEPSAKVEEIAGDGETIVLEVVAEKTGYPVEMLELDMSLDADLGIDSIKRVEILSALQDRMPNAPAVSSEDLGKFDSLRQVVDFVRQGPALKKKDSTLAEPSSEPTRTAEPEGRVRRWALRPQPLDNATRSDALQLSTSAPIWISDDGDGLAQQVSKLLQLGGVDTEIVSLDQPPTQVESLTGLILLAPLRPQSSFITQAFKLLQQAGPALRKTGQSGSLLLAGISRLDGAFGLIDPAFENTLAAGLSGMIKTAHHEWPEVVCRSIDVPPGWNNEQAAEALVEALLVRGPLETGLHDDGTFTLALEETGPTPSNNKSPVLQPGDVVVVTGGARGVTAEVAVAVAEAYRATLVLAGRSPLPEVEPAWLHGIEDEADIKRAIASNHPAKLNPRQLEAEYRRVAAAREVRETLRRVEQSGGRALYRSLDVRDAEAVRALVNEARQEGPLRGVVHGAGVLADRLIEDKTLEQFHEVYATKVEGLYALLDATREDELAVLALFSSSTARYGRKGQVDYAAGNEVLNKQAQIEAERRPACRVVSINWGPWDGGMVTPALKKLFAEEGVGVISVAGGAKQFIAEIAADPSDAVEVVVLGQLEQAGAIPASPAQAQGSSPIHASSQSMTVAFERELDIETYPFLRSHVLKGRAVLPVAIIIEWLAQGAMHENPGMAFIGFDNLEVFKGVVIRPGEQIPLQIVAGGTQTEGANERVLVQLRSGDTLHAQAHIILAASLPTATPLLSLDAANHSTFIPEGYYDDGRLFHGSAFRAIERVESASPSGLIAQVKCSPPPAAWTPQPLRSSWLADPLALDAAFQLMILWCHEFCGSGSLPASITRYRQHARKFDGDHVRVSLQVEQRAEHMATATIEFTGVHGGLIARIEGYRCVMDASLAEAFKQNRLAEQLQS